MTKQHLLNDNKKIAHYFNQACETHGDSPHSVGWFSPYTQELRFLILSLINNFDSQSVLDVGCGQGNMLGYFKKQGIQPGYYEGIDISSEMLKIACKNYPEAVFINSDFLSDDFNKEFDYVLASGTFNYKVTNQEVYIRTVINKLFSLSKKAAGFNLLSFYSPSEMKQDDDIMYFYNPVDIFKYCLSLTPYVEIKQSYLPNDFTVFMYKS
ncbi:class I SAM-dependent methyltransferase [Thermoproteota archaeon]